ncbi:MAG: ABC transporter substrate-binding protein [Roseburia sp.]|nr:ABC transporter substrate-binding protein [Roseburia sp.]MCM1098594.1 ABC transporter substrate-binding protein [Ruminococcus flavefaciens]
MKRKKLFRLLLAALLTMAVLGGCGSDGTGESSGDNSSGEPVIGGSVVVGIQQDIDSLDPHKATAAGTREILFNIFEGLVKSDKNGDLMKALASDYAVSEDGLVYTFTLREGVKFHNGNTVTAEDVKYSLERASGLLDGTPLISSLSVLTSVEILDDKTVQVTVGSANTELIYSFVAAIIPAGSGEDAEGTPIGTGPFSFVSYTPQVGIVVRKNADYWQEGLPYLDEVNFKIVNDPDTVLLELQGGSIDIYPYLTDSQAKELESSFQILSAPSVNVQAIFLNNADPLLSDVRIRQAICYALDKDMVNEFVAGGNATLISSAMLPTLRTYYVDLNDIYGTSANIDKAKELMAAAGFADGFDLEIMVPVNYEYHMQTAEVVVEQLKEAGIRATINPVEWNTWLEDCYTNRQFQATICAVTSDMTPGYLMNRFQTDSKKNFINFASDEYDQVYQKAAAAMDPAEKAGYYQELQRILNDEAGSAFIQVPPITIAVKPGLAGYVFYPVYVQDMSTVYYTKQ